MIGTWSVYCYEACNTSYPVLTKCSIFLRNDSHILIADSGTPKTRKHVNKNFITIQSNQALASLSNEPRYVLEKWATWYVMTFS